MRRNAKLAEGHATSTATQAPDAANAWAEPSERLFAELLQLNTQVWASWLTLQQTYWQQTQAMLEELPLWMSWQFGTEQLA